MTNNDDEKAQVPPPAGGQAPVAADPAPAPAGGAAIPREPLAASDDAVEQINIRAIIWTIVISAAFAVAANVALLVNYMHDNNNDGPKWDMPWQAPVAMALSVVSLVTFGGFYIAARRARIAIAASFLLTFLVMLPFSLTIPGLGSGEHTALAKSLVDQFGGVVSTVVVFYFGSEAVITGIKLWTTSLNPEAAGLLARADHDLPPTKTPTTGGLITRL